MPGTWTPGDLGTDGAKADVPGTGRTTENPASRQPGRPATPEPGAWDVDPDNLGTDGAKTDVPGTGRTAENPASRQTRATGHPGTRCLGRGPPTTSEPTVRKRTSLAPAAPRKTPPHDRPAPRPHRGEPRLTPHPGPRPMTSRPETAPARQVRSSRDR